jgi:hypothetical protein
MFLIAAMNRRTLWFRRAKLTISLARAIVDFVLISTANKAPLHALPQSGVELLSSFIFFLVHGILKRSIITILVIRLL